MTEAKVAYHHGDLRNALVETAIELVRASGSENFSLRDAASKLGVSANATYRHFDSKSALLTAVADAGAGLLAQRMKKLASARRDHEDRGEAAVAIERFKAAGRAYFAFALEDPELLRVMYGPHGICQMRRPEAALLENGPKVSLLLGDVLDAMVRAGVLDAGSRIDGDVRAWTVFHGFALLVIDGASVFPSVARRTQAFEDLLDFALRGLGVQC